ncbi:transposase [Elusimicrobiota bacterium]
METATQTASVPTETAANFIKKVRRYNRRKFTAEEKIRVILEGMKREVSATELCRKERIHPNVYYVWLKDFMEAGKARLRGDTKRAANEDEVGKLRQENDRLKIILAEQALENNLLKKSLTS